MPIVYQPAAPVGFAGGAGQAEAVERNFPTLAAAYGHAAQLRAQEAELNQRAQLANAARMQDDRQFQDRGILAANAQGEQIRAAAEHQQGQANMQAAQIFADQQHQVRGAQLSAWLNEQELSQKDRMDRQQMQNKIGVIQQARRDGTLNDEQADGLLVQIQTHLSPLDERFKQEQMKALAEQRQMHAELYRSQVKENEQKDAYQSAMLGNKFFFRADPRGVASLQKEVADSGMDPNTPQGQQEVDRLAKERGAGHWYYPDKDGKPVLDKSSELREQGRVQESSSRAESAKAEESQVAKDTETIMHGLREWEAAVVKDGGKPPSAELRQAHLEEMLKSYQKVQEAVRQSRPGGAKAAAAKQVKEKVTGDLERDIHDLAGRKDLWDADKNAALVLLHKAKYLVETYGPYEQMSPKMKGQMDGIRQGLRHFAPPSVPPPAAEPFLGSTDFSK